ncbi:hypothetical protein MTP99_012080 [Tenebrio molitor]|jgi:hypothetical protein|nr:hypothetical protein MTP99_012080 [Tenebrio molitor]
MHKFLLLVVLFEFSSGGKIANDNNSSVICTDNEIHTDCTNPCEPTCSIPYYRHCEWLICNEGCYCKDGFKKDKFQGTCVAESACQDYCLPFQKYDECGSACPPTCEDPNPTCEAACVAGCFCKEGYIFSSFFELCVKSCPNI